MLAWAYSMKRIIGLLGLAQKTARPVMAEPYCRVVVSWLTNIQADWAVGLAFEACFYLLPLKEGNCFPFLLFLEMRQ